MDIKELYQDIILEHGKSPRNLGKCEGYNRDAKGYNPLCGDKIHVYLKLDNKKKVENLTFEGEGCAISLAAIFSICCSFSKIVFLSKDLTDFLK